MGTTRPRALVAVLALVALLGAACGSSDDGTSSDTTAAGGGTTEASAATGTTEAGSDTSEAPAADGEVFRIAVVSPSARNDVAFSQSMFDALDEIAKTRKIEVAASDGLFQVEDAAAAIRGYAEDGYDLVIAHGSQFGAPLQEIAPDFPDVAFAWGTAADTFGLENVSAYTVRSDEGGYVMGAMAAELSGAGNIGIVGPVEVGDAKLYVDGFTAGAKAQKADVDVNVNYIQSFSDVALAQEAATAFVSNGADVLTGTAQMVVGATGVAQAESIPWFGTQANQTSLGPDIVVASQVYHWEVVLDQMIDAIEGGDLGGETYTATLANGGLEIEYNDGFALDAAIRKVGDDMAAGIADGSIKTGIS